MSRINVTKTLIEDLREQNALSSEALRQANNRIKSLEKQVQDSQKIISILEDRIGTSKGIDIRQKDLTIKHLELQIQDAIKQNEELEFQLNVLKSDICPCFDKNMLDLPSKKFAPKPAKCVKPTVLKKVSQRDYTDRQLMLERIIEHKDKRIDHLSKEIKKLTNAEKELTNKIYRLTKLLPKSNKPVDVLTDCLLREIQSLESQLQSYKDIIDKSNILSDKTNIPDSLPRASMSKENVPVNSEQISSSERQQRMSTNVQSTAYLHSLYDEINDLKHVFLKENEKFQHSLDRDFIRRDLIKVEWTNMINKLNYIADTIQNIIKNNSFQEEEACNTDKDQFISQLQKKLRDTLELSTKYQNENDCLQKKVSDLSEQLLQLKASFDAADNKKSSNIHTDVTYSNQKDLDRLKELLESKISELNCARDHIETQQKFISELQNSCTQQATNSQLTKAAKQTKSPQTDPPTHPLTNSELENVPSFSHSGSRVHSASTLNPKTFERRFHDVRNLPHQGFEVPSISSNDSSDCHMLHSSFSDKRINALEIKLNVSEKHIKSLQDMVEDLQTQNVCLQEKNQQLDADLYKARSEKSVLESIKHINSSLKLRLNDLKSECDELKNENQNIHDKNAQLERENGSLQKRLQTCESKRESLKSSESLLQTKLKEANNQIESLQENIAVLQNDLVSLNEKYNKSKSIHQNKEYDEDVVKLQRQLAEKENEVVDLMEDLHALQNQASQMNLHRRKLRNELEKLCNTLMAEDETSINSAQNKAIYKAALFHSAQALLQLDMDENVEESHQSSVMEELKHQYNVFLTEVARLNEVLSLKNQQRDELLREYLNIDDLGEIDVSLGRKRNISDASSSASEVESPSTVSGMESIPIISAASGVQSMPVVSTSSSMQSMPVISTSSSMQSMPAISTASRGYLISSLPASSGVVTSIASGMRSIPVTTTTFGQGSIPVISTAFGLGSIPVTSTAFGHGSVPTAGHVTFSPEYYAHFGEQIQTKNGNFQNNGGSMPGMVSTLQQELNNQKNITTYFVVKCASLEQKLKEDQDSRCKCEKNDGGYQEIIKEFKKQLKAKDSRIKHLEELQAKNVEIGVEQQKSEIDWLMSENKQLFETNTATQAELSKEREEKTKIQNEVNLLKRQLVNVKYEKAKVDNEVKHLREQGAHCQSSSSIS